MPAPFGLRKGYECAQYSRIFRLALGRCPLSLWQVFVFHHSFCPFSVCVDFMCVTLCFSSIFLHFLLTAEGRHRVGIEKAQRSNPCCCPVATFTTFTARLACQVLLALKLSTQPAYTSVYLLVFPPAQAPSPSLSRPLSQSHCVSVRLSVGGHFSYLQ